MNSWMIRWNFNKTSYSPGELAFVNFWLENTGNTYLYLSDLKLVFEFGTYELNRMEGAIPPFRNVYLGIAQIALPKNIAGAQNFTEMYNMYVNISMVIPVIKI